MKILFITHHYLSSNGGGSFASRAYINAFAENANEMTLLYPKKNGEDLFPEINKKIIAIPVEYNIPKWMKLLHLLVGRVHRFFKAAKKEIFSKQYDIVVFDSSLVSYRLIKLVKRRGAKTIVIHHNYQYEYFRDNSKGLLAIPTLFWCRRYEKQAVLFADLNLTLTKQDSALLSKNYDKTQKKMFCHLGVFEYCSKKAFSLKNIPCNQLCFVITGSLEDKQTKCSLLPWLKDYYPILKEVHQDATLIVAGKNPGNELKQACDDFGIELIPSPASMDPIIEKADFYICPTSLGGGLKLRIMDGLKHGLPVITHSVSARGYEPFVEKGCLFSYSDKNVFREILKKIKNSTFQKEDVQEAYFSLFSFDAGVERVKSILSKHICH